MTNKENKPANNSEVNAPIMVSNLETNNLEPYGENEIEFN
jgi:hypothetical protein